MGWKVKKAYSRREGVSQSELWTEATNALGLNESESSVFIALRFENFINGKELKPGLIRQMIGSRGTVHYMRLEEYDPENFRFAISICTEHLDQSTRYLIIRNEIQEVENGAIWNVEVSEKRALLVRLITGGGFISNIDAMFHSRRHFVQ